MVVEAEEVVEEGDVEVEVQIHFVAAGVMTESAGAVVGIDAGEVEVALVVEDVADETSRLKAIARSVAESRAVGLMVASGGHYESHWSLKVCVCGLV